jgi:hypothetical protein
VRREKRIKSKERIGREKGEKDNSKRKRGKGEGRKG